MSDSYKQRQAEPHRRRARAVVITTALNPTRGAVLVTEDT
jgi:NAD/NADP transhydrogenase alpha subunit